MREKPLAQVQPQTLDRVQFGGIAREQRQGEIVCHRQVLGGVPTGAIQQHHGVGAGLDRLGQFVE